jgi:beta-lactam-binding protein with PASTA domain
MKAVRKALRNRGCKVGKVTRRSPQASRVVAQSPKAGKKLPAEAKVNVTLGGATRN